MNEKTMMVLALAVGAYFLFFRGGPVTPTAAKSPNVIAPGQDQTASLVKSGLDLVTSIFNAADSGSASRGSGVAST